MNDLISRQAAIKYLMSNMYWYDEDGYESDDDYKRECITDLIDGVPSAQPKRTEKRTETHACDLISRQAAIDAIMGQPPEPHYPSWYAAQIEKLPSAQPEIIRCKDCRYYQDNNDGYPHINCKWDANETPDADDFCSGAERRTNEQ